MHPAEYHSSLEGHNALVEKLVAACHGSIYKNTGDGYYAFFERAGDCIACAGAMANGFSGSDKVAGSEPFLIRIALHAGFLRPIGAEFFGPALNRASRICQVCYPGQVLVSGVVTESEDAAPDGVVLLDLGIHHLRDLTEPERLYQLDLTCAVRREFPPLPTLANRPNNLYRQPNAFIGRTKELSELKTLLRGGQRLISLIAPGGYGKSRLAIQLCADMLSEYGNGAFLVELAPVHEASGVATELAGAIGYRFQGARDPEEQILEYLRTKQMLICFDNFEHVLSASSFVGKILRVAPLVGMIATSREPLRITGEMQYALQPLPVESDKDNLDSPYSDAVSLFADRIALVKPCFSLDAESKDIAHRICLRLDGIPLSIELAAAWADCFTLSELFSELSQQLELTARMTDVPERHRSVRASLDWSWNLLSDEQRRMLMVLSSFRGGFFAEAASAVLDIQGMPLRAALAKLADKSWLYTRVLEGKTRYFIRDAASHEYVCEKLIETGRGIGGSLYEQALFGHARYFSGFMKEEGSRLASHGQSEAFTGIRNELENLFEAMLNLSRGLETALDNGSDSKESERSFQIEEHERLLLPFAEWLGRFPDMQGSSKEMLERYRSLKYYARGSSNPELRGWILSGLARCEWRLGNYESALDCAGESRSLAHKNGFVRLETRAEGVMALVYDELGKPVEARELYDHSLALCRESGDLFGESFCLIYLGDLHLNQARMEEARNCYEASIAIDRKTGDRRSESYCLSHLGSLHLHQGRKKDAESCFREALSIARELKDRRAENSFTGSIAWLLKDAGEVEKALELYESVLSAAGEMGDRASEAACFASIGELQVILGKSFKARECFESAASIAREIGNLPSEAETLTGFSELLLAEGEIAAAGEALCRAQEINEQLGFKTDQSRVLSRLARFWIALYKEKLDGANHAEEVLIECGKDSPILLTADEALRRAKRAIAEAESLMEEMGGTDETENRREVEKAKSELRAFANEFGLGDSAKTGLESV